MSVRLRPEIVALPAYRQGREPSPDGFKLSSNENPFPPLPGVLAAAEAAHTFNRYPNGQALPLRSRLAERHGAALDQIHLGAGSISLLTQLVGAAAGAGDEYIYAWRSFEAYPGLGVVAGAVGVQVPNRPDHSHDLPAMAAAVTPRTRLVIICSPNNPTGTVVTAREFADFMTRVPDDLLVVLDEAYIEFVTEPDAVDGSDLIDRYPNLVILRTFSKAYGLAGLRIGYAVGPAAVLSAARSASIAMSVTDEAQAAALASIDLEDEIMERVARVALRRDQVRKRLLEQGWAVPQAQGNFVWLPLLNETAAAADRFFDADVAVRPFPGDGIRVTIGESESVERVLMIAQEIVRNLPEDHPARQVR